MRAQSKPSLGLTGVFHAPGDKSISHRALIFAALAEGVSSIGGLLEGEDVIATANAMAAFGATVERLETGRWRVSGKGRFQEPGDVLDFGNSGTGSRLVMGACATQALTAVFTGDESLRSRPMGRILDPLRLFGAQALSRSNGLLPMALKGAPGAPGVRYETPMASAQVKSAVLLAGLNADGETHVTERVKTRDHTERMIANLGGEVETRHNGDGSHSIWLRGGPALKPFTLDVPGDPSSAAFAIAAALVTPDSEITVKNVLLNPTRTGLFETLKEMGADLSIENVREAGGEDAGDIRVRHSALQGVDVPAERAASMIDEYPILAVVAAFAAGETRMNGLDELRVKESDRLTATQALLSANGVEADISGDDLIVRGRPTRQSNDRPAGGGLVRAHHDHRIAMASLILGLGAKSAVTVEGAESIATSYPAFFEDLGDLGAQIDPLETEPAE